MCILKIDRKIKLSFEKIYWEFDKIKMKVIKRLKYVVIRNIVFSKYVLKFLNNII